MAEEKAGLDIDDWLDDLEEDKSAAAPSAAGAAVGGDLDQSDIDALLGGGGPAPAAPPPPAAEAAGGDLDQSDIDALLGGGPSAPAAPSAAGGDLDQGDIDALLGGAPTAPAPDSSSGELDQSDIDSLFATAAPPAAPSSASPPPASDSGLDQSDIDSLFAEAPPAPEPPAGTSRFANDDDLDELFAGMGEDSSDGMKTVGFEEVARSAEPTAPAAAAVSPPAPAEEESFGLPEDSSGFDDHDEFDFGDLPDIPDETEGLGTATVGMSGSGRTEEEDIFGPSTGRAAEPDLEKILAEDTTHARQEIPIDTAPHAKPAGRGTTMKKKLLVFAVLGLAVVAGGGYFYLHGKKVLPEAGPAAVKEQPPAPPVNSPPEVADVKLQLARPGEAVSFVLTGKDKENDPLQFEILTPPKFGVLSGDVPSLTYIPNPDFPGEDGFEYRATDGKHASAPAKVVITGQPAPPPAPVKAKAETPAKAKQEEKPPLPPLAVANAKLHTKSTAAVVIDWKKIWPQASEEEMPEGLTVEVVGQDLRGTLSRLDHTRFRYQPDRYFGGKAVVRYRFTAPEHAPSKVGQVTISVTKNDKPPKLVLQPTKEYQVGDKVVLDASKSTDDSPGSLRFSWDQSAGVSVRLVPMNGAGSVVSFVAPSSFHQQERISVRVTAIDPGGQQTSKEIEVSIVSKRRGHSPLWGY